METLGTALPKELDRVREILKIYEEIGPAGIFGATMIKALLKRTEQAMMEQDLAAMCICFKELKECQA